LLDHAQVLLIDSATSLEVLADLVADARRGSPALRVAAHLPLLARAEERDVAVERDRRDLAPSALVGTYDAVAAALATLARAGLDIVVLSAPDQIQEVHIAGEQVIGRFRAAAAIAA
jgi:alkanesulfonate monooxygenase